MQGHTNIINPVILLLLSAALTLGSCAKECKERYSGITIRGASRKVSNAKNVGGYYETDFLINECNFWLIYNTSSEGFQGCREITKTNTLNKADIRIYCSGPVVIGNDTINKNINLYRYFRLLEFNGNNDVLTFNTAEYPFPVFPNIVNNFKIEVGISDGTVISGTKIISVN